MAVSLKEFSLLNSLDTFSLLERIELKVMNYYFGDLFRELAGRRT